MLRALQIGMESFSEHPSGVNRYFHELLRHLNPLQVAVQGLIMGAAEAPARDAHVRAVAQPGDPLVMRWRALRSYVRAKAAEAPVDLIVSHFALYAFPVLDLAGQSALVVHFHGPWALEGRHEGGGRAQRLLKAALERIVYRRAARLIVLSEAFARLLSERYGVAAERVRIVPGGVDVSWFAEAPPRLEARAALGWDLDRPIVLAVRRLVRRTGVEDLVAAADRVRRRLPDTMFLVAGSGPLAGELEARIRTLDLAGRVRLLGRIPEDQLALAYRAADLTVVPSVALEGFGLIVAESLSAGTPVLVTPVGGLPEAVQGLSPAMVLPAAGPAAIAEGIADALLGRLTLPAPEVCLEYARARYDWPVVAGRVAAVYREATG